jgi:hypothetical protein
MRKFIEVPAMLQTEDFNANGACLIRGVELMFEMASMLSTAMDFETQERVGAEFARKHGLPALVAMQADLMTLSRGAKIMRDILRDGVKTLIREDGAPIPTIEEVEAWNEQREKLARKSNA